MGQSPTMLVAFGEGSTTTVMHRWWWNLYSIINSCRWTTRTSPSWTMHACTTTALATYRSRSSATLASHSPCPSRINCWLGCWMGWRRTSRNASTTASSSASWAGGTCQVGAHFLQWSGEIGCKSFCTRFLCLQFTGKGPIKLLLSSCPAVRNTFSQKTALKIFLKFGMKLGIQKCRKVNQTDFFLKSSSPILGLKGANLGQKSTFSQFGQKRL